SDARGSIFNLTVNDVEVGAVAFSPFRGDITDSLKNGENVIEIEVVSTLRNALGPHHHRDGENLELTCFETILIIPCGNPAFNL
ncbi:unnamed protein product, partial [marine sediment metagenome]